MAKQRTIFLGAGASVDAGYPLTANLYNELKKFYSGISEITLKANWDEFNKYRNYAKGRIGSILKSDNLEVVLTLPDLLAASLKEYDLSTHKRMQIKDPIVGAREYLKRALSKERKDLEKAERISEIFLGLLEHFLGDLSFKNWGKSPPQYYKNMLNGFDNIITTNWDNLCERTLLAWSQWAPFDGYGFELSDEIKGRTVSEKMLYKLHGSTGWRCETQSGKLFLDSKFKKYLLNHYSSMTDPREWPGNSEHIFITPSYLKQLNNRYIIEIWKGATQAICTSSELCIVGYSITKCRCCNQSIIIGSLGKEYQDNRSIIR